MNDTVIIPNSTSQWFHQFHDQTIHAQALASSSSSSFGLSSDSTIVTTITSTGFSSDHSSMLSPSSSTTITPKGIISKPIRRRSRASKKTPTTLLNANTSNFRSLVQQFTGCTSSKSRPTSVLAQRGPINLNFQLGSAQNHSTETTAMASFYTNSNSNNDYVQNNYQTQQILQQPQEQGQQQLYDYHCMFPVDDGCGADNIETPDEFDAMNDFSLHQFSAEAISGELMDDGSLFYP